jgi:phosphoglucomutase
MSTLIISVSGLRGKVGESLDAEVVMNYITAYVRYLEENGLRGPIVLGYDGRQSGLEILTAAEQTFAAHGRQVLPAGVTATPTLGFLVKHLRAAGGVQVTASHNPAEYNGYKAFWSDGGQVVAPYDTEIIEEVRKINSVSQIKFNGLKENIEIIGKETDDLFLNEILKIRLNHEIIQKNSGIGIVYSPIHGTGVKVIPDALKLFGFKNIISVAEQDVVDGNFPTVKSPNPEEPGALKMAIAKAVETNADIVMATDPDADRLGIAVRNKSNEFVLINGNQTSVLLIWYILSQYKEKGLYKGNEYVIKTIVTTDLIEKIAEHYNVECFNVLTGFKFFGELIKENEGVKKYIGGGEESYGFLAGEYVRDKDAVGSCALFAEIAAWSKQQGKSVLDTLIDIYLKHGLYKEKLLNIDKRGKEGADEIKTMMADYRNNPPTTINGSRVIKIADYELGTVTDKLTGVSQKIDLAKSNVLQFFLDDGSKISIRPSGTEPKIKFYFSVNKKIGSANEFETAEKSLDKRIDDIIKDMNLL